MNKLNEAFTDVEIEGVDSLCYAVCDDYIHQPPFNGSPYQCDSDWDYYGFTQFSFSIYDDKGNDMSEIIDALPEEDYDNLYTILLKEYEDQLGHSYLGDY